MSSRDNILQRIRAEISKGPAVAPPPVPEVWPASKTIVPAEGLSQFSSDENGTVPLATAPAALIDRFAQELKVLQGEFLHAATMEAAQEQVRRMADEAQWQTIGAADRPLVREVGGKLPPERIVWVKDDRQPRDMAQMPVSLIEAECLLADTGTCVVACHTAPRRLLCYLPPACIIAARVDRLFEHLPAAWPLIKPRVEDPQARGELVLITGPSRTSDIEKVLILGVHGPKRLVVLLVD
jgi:L-lactate dehydrogenase complex protein LldG